MGMESWGKKDRSKDRKLALEERRVKLEELTYEMDKKELETR